jgi:surfeit locus 1 family protein
MNPRARRWIVTVVALATALLCARLGLWQLDRAQQKRALQAAIDTRSRLPPLAQSQLARSAEAAATQHYRPVRLHGRWLAERTVYLDNRQMNGHPGFFVVTPLLLGPNDAVLVQRGWVPRNFENRTALPPVATPGGEVDLLGRVAPPPARLFDFAGGASGPIRQNLDLADFSREAGVALRPLSVQQLNAGSATPGDTLQRDWLQPAVDIDKHLGYAFQWFAFSGLVTGLYVWFQLLRPRLRQR